MQLAALIGILSGFVFSVIVISVVIAAVTP